MKGLSFVALLLLSVLGSGSVVNAALTENVSLPAITVIDNYWFLNPLPIPCRHFQVATGEQNPHLNHRYFCSIYIDGYERQTFAAEHQVEVTDPSETKSLPEFAYNIRIRNDHQRAIRAISWNYVFSDPQSGLELARHRFYSVLKLSPGQTRTLTNFSVRAPTQVVSAGMLARANGMTYQERIEIKAIRYSDGSIWPGPRN